MHKHRTLRTKLTSSFAVLGLGPLLLMGALALWVMTVTHRQDVATMETQLLNQKTEEIEKFIAETIGLFEIRVGYAETSVIRIEDQKFLLEKLLEENKSIFEASLVDLTGKETLKHSRVQDASLVELTNVSALPKFQAAKRHDRYFGPVYYTLDGPMMSVAAPVLNRLGQVIMVLSGEVDLSSLNDILASARLGRNGYVYLLDQNGTIISSSDRSLTYQQVDVETTPWMQTVFQGVTHTGRAPDDRRLGLLGIEVLAAGTQLKELGWGMVVEWPYRDAFSVVARIQRQALGFSLATIVAVAFLGWLVGRGILRPLALLRQGAQKIGSGKFDYKITITTRDEMEELGEVFNRMGDDLKRLEELKATEIRAQALAESLRKEQELSRMKDEFMANTSHQLRTPLSIMNWGFELLVETKEPHERKSILSDVQSGLAEINAIVADLLLASEFGPGFKNVLWGAVDLAELLRKVMGARATAMQEKEIRWEEAVSQDLPKISANARAFEIVLSNLIDNAITYTPAKGWVKATLERKGNEVHVALSDSGLGIPEKDKPSIFTQFFRASNAIAGKNVGTGLGLYIVKNIIEGHGGKLWFESQEGKGSTFHVTLPIGAV